VADDPQSPHLAADRIAATVYVAGAEDDDHFTPEQAELLDAALTGAGRAPHGGVLPGEARVRGAGQPHL
jgi:hypothetical protein